jgi:uncharacterized protein Smg (DUF494 family)
MNKNLLEKIFYLINKYYHFKRIKSYINKLKINNMIDVGFHKGEFYEAFHSKKNIMHLRQILKHMIIVKKKFVIKI